MVEFETARQYHDAGPSFRLVEDCAVEERKVEDIVYDRLRGVDRILTVALEVECRPEGLGQAEWGMVLWRAKRRLLTEGITFAQRKGFHYRTNAVQTERRGKSHSGAAKRKLNTAVLTLRNAADMAVDPTEKARLERAMLRHANTLVDTKAAERAAGRTRAKGV